MSEKETLSERSEVRTMGQNQYSQENKLQDEANETLTLLALLSKKDQIIGRLNTELLNLKSELLQKSDDTNRKIAGIVDQSWGKDLEISCLEKNKTGLKQTLVNIESSNQTLSNGLRSTEQELKTVKMALSQCQSTLRETTDSAAKKIHELEATNSTNRKELTKVVNDFNMRESSYNEERTYLKEQTRLLNNELAVAKAANQQQIDDFNKLKQTYLDKLDNEEKEIKKLKSAEEKLQFEINQLLTQLKTEATRCNNANTDLNQALESLHKTELVMEKATRKNETEKHSILHEKNLLKSEIERLNHKITLLTSEQVAADRKIRDEHTQRHDLEQKIQNLSLLAQEAIDLRKSVENAQQLEKTQAENHAKQVSELQNQIIDERAKFKNLQSQMVNLSHEREQLNKTRHDLKVKIEKFEIQEQKLAKEQKQLHDTSLEIENREAQLRSYATALTREKTEALRFSKQLAEELRAARATHPLKDYLRLTEFELTKIEVQLKKTPALSTERPQLESCLTQLIEQREFLKNVLASTQRQLEARADEFLKAIQSGRLAPVPPLPPSKQKQSKRPETRPEIDPEFPSDDPAVTNTHSPRLSADTEVNWPEFQVKWANLNQDLT